MTPQHVRDTGDATSPPAGACKVLFERRNRPRPADAPVWSEAERAVLLAAITMRPLP